LFVAVGECVLLHWRQNRTLSGDEILLQKIMATIANASLLSDLELQREQELAKARAIQIGMLPQGALRTADRAICYSFYPYS
jgi:hypothetical protein